MWWDQAIKNVKQLTLASPEKKNNQGARFLKQVIGVVPHARAHNPPDFLLKTFIDVRTRWSSLNSTVPAWPLSVQKIRRHWLTRYNKTTNVSNKNVQNDFLWLQKGKVRTNGFDRGEWMIYCMLVSCSCLCWKPITQHEQSDTAMDLCTMTMSFKRNISTYSLNEDCMKAISCYESLRRYVRLRSSWRAQFCIRVWYLQSFFLNTHDHMDKGRLIFDSSWILRKTHMLTCMNTLETCLGLVSGLLLALDVSVFIQTTLHETLQPTPTSDFFLDCAWHALDSPHYIANHNIFDEHNYLLVIFPVSALQRKVISDERLRRSKYYRHYWPDALWEEHVARKKKRSLGCLWK